MMPSKIMVEHSPNIYKLNYRKGGKFLKDGSIKRFFFKNGGKYAEHIVSPKGFSMTKVEVDNQIVKIVIKKLKGVISITKVWDIKEAKPKEFWQIGGFRYYFN